MKKLYKVLLIIFILLLLFFPLFIILYIWDFLTEPLFDKIIFTNMILSITVLIIALLISKTEESEKEIK